ncbi:MAG TPA: diacylglycerol kinase family protein [Kineosporiaceae bacterium]
MTAHGGGTTPARAVIVMNPRSGDGKVTRFRLIERAERLGARVMVTGGDLSAAALARFAVEEGAQVLGVAGGDGTVAAVAAVAADTDRPLVVVPAGTRNHFARDVGLDTRNPVRALTALVAADPVRVDLGSVESHVFVNNVSFGMYAEALLEPGYRQAKARSFASVAPRYLEGRRWVEARIDTPVETTEDPQVVLVSNNPYHLSTVRYLGRRFSLSTGQLGVIVIKRPADLPPLPPPDLLPRLRQDLRRHGRTGSPGTGVVTWCAPQVTLAGAVSHLTAGIDGEPVDLHLPITCRILPAALQILLPQGRPGVPEEPARDRGR